MQILTRKVEDRLTGRKYGLICVDKKWEKENLPEGNQTPKVLSVDAVLKATLAVLQIILIGLITWVLTTIVSHDARLTRNETVIEQWRLRDAELIQMLREMNEKQQTMINNQVSVQTDLVHLKEGVKELQKK